MPSLILLNKPFGVLCNFSPEPGRQTLKDFIDEPEVYPAGRLDADSEGLVLLTSDGALQHRIADPRHKLPKTYFVQVEGLITDAALRELESGVTLGDLRTAPAEAQAVAEPAWLWPRTPPVRFRRNIPTSWLTLVLQEGKNRQVRRMTAAVGFPTLRLVRYSIGQWTLDGLAPGESRELEMPRVAEAARPRRERWRGTDAPKRQPIRAERVKLPAILPRSPRKKR